MEIEPIDIINLVAASTLVAALGFAVFFRYQDKQEEKAKQQQVSKSNQIIKS